MSTATRAAPSQPAPSVATITRTDPAEAPTLSFPPSPVASTLDPTLLAPFKNESSAYATIAKACLTLTQHQYHASDCEDSTSVASSTLTHDASYIDATQATFQALIACLQQHKDRRCRLLAAKTVAIVAKSAYARVRQSPLVFSMRDSKATSLEDEVGTEVPVALITSALEDLDDGVSACCVEALGILVTTAQDNELMRAIQSIAFAHTAVYAPSLQQCLDEDPCLWNSELSVRILENILAPRLLPLIDRISLYSSTALVALTLPVLTASLVYQVQEMPARLILLDRATFSKRWMQVDAIGLVDAAVQSLILPGLQSGGSVALTAAMSGLRLVACLPYQSWERDVCVWAVRVLYKEVSMEKNSIDIETKMAMLAALIVALRGLPVQERTHTLGKMAGVIIDELPCTTVAPHGVCSAGVLMEGQYSCYRRPARIGLWTEIALSFFIDGPVEEVAPLAEKSPGGRVNSLQDFFLSEAMVKTLTEKNRSSVLPLYDELLVAFCSVGVDTGLRFRVAPDGTLLVVDQDAPQVQDWLSLTWVVLTTFLPCVCLVQNTLYLEENATLLSAGQASYVRLVQNYLYMIGMLDPGISVAIKLGPNACPPQLLWDQLSESSSFLSKFGPVTEQNEADKSSRLMEEFVAREIKQGLASHHVRMFLLTMAADHWIQGRSSAVRQMIASGSVNNSVAMLNVNTGRDIVMALSPKRIIAKIYEGHTAPVDENGKKKRDPIKNVAKEAVRACVAAIENIALVSVDWRRRFGQSHESKHLLSIAVGILQGKVDETPLDDSMKSIMTPFCPEAVQRIQALHEGDGRPAANGSFPLSKLILEPVKPKIKPLISTSKPVILGKEKMVSANLMQLCRQIISARTDQALLSSPPADSTLFPARPTNWLRLSSPPLHESQDARLNGNVCEPMSAWGSSVVVSSASSDATALIAAYTPRRYFRYDGEDEYRLAVLIRVYNTTALEYTEGIRLEMGVYTSSTDSDDPLSQTIADSLGGGTNGNASQEPLISCAVVCRQEVKAGDHLTWEISLDPTVPIWRGVVIPSVVYRNVPVEADSVGSIWAGDGTPIGVDACAESEEANKTGEDDFQVTTSKTSKAGADAEVSSTETITVPGEPLFLSPLIGLQPCPLVFFRDGWGDMNTFRFFWFMMPHRAAPIKLTKHSNQNGGGSFYPMDKKLANLATLHWTGEAIPGGFVSKAWAFSTLAGHRVLCALAEIDASKTSSQGFELYFRGEETAFLLALTGSKTARSHVVSALLPAMLPVN
jgi:hypothetical protein